MATGIFRLALIIIAVLQVVNADDGKRLCTISETYICECEPAAGNGNMTWIVNCADQKIEGAVKPINPYPFDVSILKLDNNNLKTVPANTFDGLPMLWSLRLNENQIETIADDAFVGLEDLLRYLNIGHNKLTEFPRAISKLYGLTHLHLRDNKITFIPDGALDKLIHLEKVYFSDNLLTSLIIPSTLTELNFFDATDNLIEDVTIDSGLQKLTNVQMAHNKLTVKIFFTRTFTNILKNMETLNLNYNNWYCVCNSFLDWLMMRGFHEACLLPTIVRGQSVAQYHSENCPPLPTTTRDPYDDIKFDTTPYNWQPDSSRTKQPIYRTTNDHFKPEPSKSSRTTVWNWEHKPTEKDQPNHRTTTVDRWEPIPTKTEQADHSEKPSSHPKLELDAYNDDGKLLLTWTVVPVTPHTKLFVLQIQNHTNVVKTEILEQYSVEYVISDLDLNMNGDYEVCVLLMDQSLPLLGCKKVKVPDLPDYSALHNGESGSVNSTVVVLVIVVAALMLLMVLGAVFIMWKGHRNKLDVDRQKVLGEDAVYQADGAEADTETNPIYETSDGMYGSADPK
ncbi:unnamed protein product [Owenia fusiformis]|uniref:Uncharacterized protein n=1 Tax=Owenia fusiformis TaxID=6347 RepID=A0A8J1TG19_OWEFU|nr:unnamed protein product [Owenia fusiformis]